MTGAPGQKKARPILTVVVVLTALLFGGVALYRFVPPPWTWLMTDRLLQGEGRDYRWRSLDDISPRLVEAVIASEDATFCAHSGFDMKAIEKALKTNARVEKRGRGRIRGGSTISQQTAKNVFLWPGRDWVRKGLEAGYTVLIETIWGKRRIMEVYLNVAEWGPGVYGAEAAARHWYGKSARELTPREAARLAAILPSPRRYKAASPGPYVRRRAARIQAAMGTVRNDGLSACVSG
jgi:monofunctional biosynthetic peptidoglycan transglycosylase